MNYPKILTYFVNIKRTKLFSNRIYQFKRILFHFQHILFIPRFMLWTEKFLELIENSSKICKDTYTKNRSNHITENNKFKR